MKKNAVSLGIAPDDLGVGDFVAVVEPKEPRKPKFIMGRDSDGDPIVMMNSEQKEQGCPGVPHKVLGLSWPWAVFGILVPGGSIEGPIIHDLRKIKCMRLNDSYVKAISAFEKPESEKPSEPEMPF